MQLAFIITTLVVVGLIFGRYYKKRDGVLSSIFFTIEITLIVWVNIPLLVTLPPNASLEPGFVAFPFKLYQLFGLGYTLAANALLTIIGAAVSNIINETEPHCSKKNINNHFNRFIENATALRVIGKDLDFLLRKDCAKQKEKLIDLKDQVAILCANPYSRGLNMDHKTKELIHLYHELSLSGNVIRFYDSNAGISNLLGQIKMDNQKKEIGLFVHKLESREDTFTTSRRSKFTYQKQLNGFLLDGVISKFDEAFDNALNPIIKFIALDIGGVYLKGDIDIFFDFLARQYAIKIHKKPTDRLDLSKKLSIGKISVLDYIETTCTKSSKTRFIKLSESDRADILGKWKSTWEKDDEMYTLIEHIISLGFEVIPFSNVDKDNGEMYLRENYLPRGCRHHVLSYQKGASKSDGALFDQFVGTVNEMVNCNLRDAENPYRIEEYQILLIDDQQDNINVAEKRGWDVIHFDRNSGQQIGDLIEALKSKAILPQNFSLH